MMCELREGMWCDCASCLLITCSQSAVWAACRNYKSEWWDLCGSNHSVFHVSQRLTVQIENSYFILMCVFLEKGGGCFGGG